MDVDLLRPGTVPIPPGTILWFEFLLNPNLLKNHLSKPSPDPSATDLIIKFSSIAPEPQPPEVSKPIDLDDPESPPLSIVESQKYTKKHLALKILCLKVAAHLKWNLNILETKLPRIIQSQLMQDLIYMATDGCHSEPPVEVSNEMMKRGGVLFSLVLYHRWLLRFLVNRALMTRQSKQAFMNMGVMTTEAGFVPMHPNFEQTHEPLEHTRIQSLNFLTQITSTWSEKGSKIIKIPSPDTFATLNEDTVDMDHNWESYQLAVTEDEMLMQIHYDLCSNHFFYGQYNLAKKHIVLCNQSKEKLKTRVKLWGGFGTSDYASVTEEEIEGYMKALNVSQVDKGLLHKLQDAVENGYEGLLEVMEADNLAREISLVHRHVVEMDMQAASTSGAITVSRDLLNKVASLNVVRSVLEGYLPSTHVDFNQRFHSAGHKFVETLLWAFTSVLTSKMLTPEDESRIKNFFIHLAMSEHKIPISLINKHLESVKIQGSNKVFKLFSESEVNSLSIELNGTDIVVPPELLSSDWECPDYNAKSIKDPEAHCLRQLIDAMTAERIRECLVSLAVTNPSQSLWQANPQWKLPIPLHSVVMSLPMGFLKDFSFVLLGKAKQLGEMGDYAAALELLLILETEMRNQLNQLSSGGSSASNHAVLYKLCKLVGWEVLLTQVTQVLSDWPNHKANMTSLLKNCNLCILAVQSGDSVIPRLEIVEQCCLCLLNGGEWDKITNNGGWASGAATAAAAAAQACQQLMGSKPHKKLPKDLWDMVLPIFATNYSGAVKRSNTGQPVYSGSGNSTRNNQDQQSTGNTKMRDGMLSFFSKLREPTVLNVVISLLARLFNILKDDSNMDLNTDYVSLWPSLVGNTNSYSLKSVSETLHQLVTQALKYYPNNISWIKLLGDMSMVGGHYSTSMKHYLSALTIMSDHFVRPLTKQLVEDQTIFKRMIKCCNHLNCPTQAAILCQFLEETDYVLAFKCLSDTSHLCSDAMDSYYGCIWDTSILEYLINLHHKRGETHRKQLAVKVMGMLELNSNNNEEIQREAANSRKAKFMRALVRQYVC